MLIYNLDNSSCFSLILTDKVLSHFEKHKQLAAQDKEAGGQLFARFDNSIAWIEEITGPRPTDKRTRTSYRPDRAAEQREIFKMYKENLHYIGDWHTHPSPVPEASGVDIYNIRSCVTSSAHGLNGFIMIIIGTSTFPLGLRISFHNKWEDLLFRGKESEISHYKQ